jgi:NADH-quinone oxidoreductase subunit I/electron transport complex protein RnfC
MTIEFERGTTYTVDRGTARNRSGQGMLAGMGVVLEHFRDAFTKKLDDPSKISGLYTVQYPEEREHMPEATRTFPILLYEDASGQELCTSCFQCERICPPQVIHITQAKDPATGKPVPAVSEFILEYDACMSCGLCAEVCPFDAIKMDHVFELSTASHAGLTIDRVGLLRPVSYYATLAPGMWEEVAEGALKKLQSAAKRRTGGIGIAGRGRSETPGAHVVPAAPATPEAHVEVQDLPIEHAAEAPALDPAAAKAAKLAAIRAANAMRAGATGTDASLTAPSEPLQQATLRSEPSAPPAAADPAAEKAAKLAAIRAANAAKKAQNKQE